MGSEVARGQQVDIGLVPTVEDVHDTGQHEVRDLGFHRHFTELVEHAHLRARP